MNQRPDEPPEHPVSFGRKVRKAIVQAGCEDELPSFDANAASIWGPALVK